MYDNIKTAMTNAGYAVSEGSDWTPADQVLYREYCYFRLGIPDIGAIALISYPAYFQEQYPTAYSTYEADLGEEEPEEPEEEPEEEETPPEEEPETPPEDETPPDEEEPSNP
jgi:hypothetical protein